MTRFRLLLQPPAYLLEHCGKGEHRRAPLRRRQVLDCERCHVLVGVQPCAWLACIHVRQLENHRPWCSCLSARPPQETCLIGPAASSFSIRQWLPWSAVCQRAVWMAGLKFSGQSRNQGVIARCLVGNRHHVFSLPLCLARFPLIFPSDFHAQSLHRETPAVLPAAPAAAHSSRSTTYTRNHGQDAPVRL